MPSYPDILLCCTGFIYEYDLSSHTSYWCRTSWKPSSKMGIYTVWQDRSRQ